MCGRYVIAGTTELSERFQLRSIPFEWFPTWNAAPSQQLPVVLEDAAGERAARLMPWGLLPRWRREGQPSIAPINARSETLLEKPMFRGLVGTRRCIVPINGFYEWQDLGGKVKQPFYITAKDGGLWGLAGLYDEVERDGETVASFTVVTTGANPLLRPLHERMPVILRRQDEAEWLDREVTDPLQVERLLLPFPEERIALWPVSPAVNSVRNDNPTLVEPMEAQKPLM